MKLKLRLPEIRARHGRMTLTELSQKTGIALSTLSRLDSGKSHRMDYSTILTLCKFFKVHPGDLFEIIWEEGDEPFSPLDLAATA